MRRDLPSGTVTFLFTDVEGSTRLLHSLGAEGYADALAEHRRVIRAACAAEGGVEVDTQGDAFFFAFPTAPGAGAAAAAMTEGLATGPIQVRVGLHTGRPLLTDEGYVGDDVHFAARVASSGHGGQVILSAATAELVESVLTDLGEHRLKDIEQAVPILQLGDASFPPLKTISNTNLPRPASSFVGREAELAEVVSRIEAGARLLTLTGPGGTGKTRLAIEAASTLVPEYKAGVFWVGLASLRDPALVAEAIGQTLGAKDSLVEHIAERELLLLLDNLEQVIECAPELSTLLQACPNLTLLVTSRELLRIQGEVEYAVPPLASPEAVSLFCERARLEPSEVIAELCARLDSLPLAIELAAARTRALTVAQILERLSGRLDLLKGGRDADPRQQTLRATIEWSYELLSSAEQQLFARLSVFAGGCKLEAAEEVADADLDTLQSLVEKSLLRFSNERFWMLETIREYASERLGLVGDADAVLGRHARFLCTSLAEPHLLDRARWALELEVERDNLRAALRWALDAGNAETRLHLASAYGWLCMVSGPVDDGKSLLVAALKDAPEETGARARALWGLGALAWRRGETDLCRRCHEECLVIARKAGDRRLVGRSLRALGIMAAEELDEINAMALLTEALSVFRNLGDRAEIDECLTMVGYGAMVRGDYKKARGFLEEALASARTMGHSRGVMRCAGNLAIVARRQDRVQDALELNREGLVIARELADVGGVASFLAELGFIAADRDRRRPAAVLLGGAEALYEATDSSFDADELEQRDRALVWLSQGLPSERLEEFLAAGRTMTVDQLVLDALEFVRAELSRVRAPLRP